MNPRPGSFLPERCWFDKVTVARLSARWYLGTYFIPVKGKIIESFRLWKEGPIINLTFLNQPLKDVPKCLIYLSSKYLQRWWLNCFPEQLLQWFTAPLVKKFFPNSQPKPPLLNPEVISTCLISCFLGDDTNPHVSNFLSGSCRRVRNHPEPSFLHTKPPQFPQNISSEASSSSCLLAILCALIPPCYPFCDWNELNHIQ